VTTQDTVELEVRLRWWALPVARVLYFLCWALGPIGMRLAPRATRAFFIRSIGWTATHAGCIRSDSCKKAP
jgi:hypothetical protein